MAEPYVPLLSRKKLLGASEEAVAGAIETMTVADLMAANIYDAKMVPLDMLSEGERMPQGHYLGNVTSIIGKQLGQLTFRQELRHGDPFALRAGSGLLTGMGYELSTSTYVPTSDMSKPKTWTFALWEDGRKKQLYGCMGTAVLTWENGGRVFADYTWLGSWQAPVDESMPAQAPVTTAPYVATSAVFTIGGAAVAQIASGTIDLGASIEPREDITKVSGVVHFHVGSRAPRVTLDLEARKVAEGAGFADLLAMTEAALVLTFTDGTNTLAVAAPKLQRINIGDDERGGRLVDSTEFQCNASAGDDELTFTESV